MEILNRMGHCVGYSTVEELETELTFEANKNSKQTSFRMKTTSELNTGTACNNFDRFVETKSGKNILHDTLGTAYQMRDVTMTNLTAMHSEKSANRTDSLPLSKQPGIRQKHQLSQKKKTDWLLLLMEQVETRTAGNVEVCMNQQSETLNHTTKNQKLLELTFYH